MVKIITMLTKFIITLLVAIAAAFSFSSCKSGSDWGNEPKGNGNLTNETRSILDDYTAIDVSASIEVVIEQSEKKSVIVTAESNLQPNISTKVANGVLTIKPINGGFNATKPIIVYIKNPKITDLEASSNSKITTTNTITAENISIRTSSAAEIESAIESDNITCKTSSGSKIKIAGKALTFKANASSGSQISAYKMWANQITADASSGATITLHPIVDLTAKASSGANIKFDSNPKTITKTESSGGNITAN